MAEVPMPQRQELNSVHIRKKHGRAIIYHSCIMTVAKDKRTVNHRKAFELMLAELADGAIDTTLFDTGVPPFRENVLRTTWEELLREGYVEAVGARWRLTTKAPKRPRGR